MDYTNISNKLDLLYNLVIETELEDVTDDELFDNHLIETINMTATIQDLETGRKSVDIGTTRQILISIMKSANKIWRIRNKIKNGEYSSVIAMDDEIEDLLAEGSKIEAIKYYRTKAKELTGKTPSLKGSRDYVDGIEVELKRKGVLC